MPDTLTIVADTLRTMMGATAAEPYVRAIEKAVNEACVSLTNQTLFEVVNDLRALAGELETRANQLEDFRQ